MCHVCYRGGWCLVLADKGEGGGCVSGNDLSLVSYFFQYYTRQQRRNSLDLQQKKEYLESGQQEEDLLYLDSRTTGKG